MFLINSRFSLDSATQPPTTPRHGACKEWAPLLPKLRGHFAEFLNHDSLARLSMLYPTTSVGFGYGRSYYSRRCFSRQYRITLLPTKSGHHQASPTMSPGFTKETGHTLKRAKPLGTRSYLPASHLLTRLPPTLRTPRHPHQQQTQQKSCLLTWHRRDG